MAALGTGERQPRSGRRVPSAVWAVTALFAVLLVAWAVLAPLGHAPDEAAHADLVFQQATGASYPSFDGRRSSAAVIAVWANHTPTLSGRRLTPEAASSREGRQSLDELGSKSSAFPNQMPQHPPLYYKLMGSALRLERNVTGSERSVEGEWLLLRLLNALLVVPLPLLAWAAARRLGATGTAAITAAIVPLAVPQLLHIGASINNDNLLILLSAILAVLIAGVLAGDGRPSRAIAIGVIAGLALLTKAFALALLPWIGLAYGVQLWRSRDRRKEYATSLVIAGGVAALMAAWWYIRNLVRHGDLSPSVLDPSFARAPAGFHPDLFWYLHHFITTVIQRFWGNFGYYEAPVSPALVVAATAAVVAAVAVVFVRRADPARDGAALVSRTGLAVFGSLVLFLVAIVAYNGFSLYRSSGRTPFMQGRYLFGAMVPFAVLTAIGVARVIGRWSGLLVLGVAAVMQIDGFRVGLRAWWAEPHASVARRFDALLAWSPLDRGVIVALMVVLAVTGIVTVLVLVRVARGSDATGRSPTDGSPERRPTGHISAVL